MTTDERKKLWNEIWGVGLPDCCRGSIGKKYSRLTYLNAFCTLNQFLFKSQILTVIKELNSLSLYVLHDNLRKGSAYDFFLVKLINHSGGSLLYYDVFFFI